MRSSKFFVGYCGSSLFPCHVVFSRGSMSRPWIPCFRRHSSPYRGMEFAGGIQGVEPQLPGMSGALPSAAPVRRELLRDRYFAMPVSSGKRTTEPALLICKNTNPGDHLPAHPPTFDYKKKACFESRPKNLRFDPSICCSTMSCFSKRPKNTV